MTYNGWTNRETWLVNIWFNPETPEDVEAAREILEEEESNLSGCLKDMSGLSEVNWDELREAVAPEEEEEPEEDEDEDEEAE